MGSTFHTYQRAHIVAPPVTTVQSTSSLMPQTEPADQQGEEEQYISTFFCKALYDYQSNDASSLCFRKGDIIEVLTRLESGWWDGLLGEERGWFPSNYVTVISEQEAEAALTSSAYDASKSSPLDDSVVDMGDSMSRALSESDRDGDWLEREADFVPVPYDARAIVTHGAGNGMQHHDFWVPQVGSDGRIFYVNTQTGEVSQDLPLEADEDADQEVMPDIRSTGARAGPKGMNGFVQEAGFGVQRRSGTPEPWVRRLADDGLTYYYYNKLDGTLSWTLPTAHTSASGNGDEHVQGTSPQGASSALSGGRPPMARMRSDSSVSRSRDRGHSTADRLSVYSDDSDVQPLQRSRSETSVNAVKAANGSRSNEPTIQTIPEQSILDLTPAEQAIQDFQRSLAPHPPGSPLEMANSVREAIADVVEFLQTSSPRRPDHSREVNNRVLTVVTTVRNLLYVTATPSGHIPSHLYPRQAQDAKLATPSQSLQAHLKAAHRKVAGTLSKLVLSALAMQYDPTLSVSDKPNRMESDAAELERSIVAFIAELQRYQQEHPSKPGDIKRLYAAFSPVSIGPGVSGAGMGGDWTGFGFAVLANGQNPATRTLEPSALAELRDVARTTQSLLDALKSSSQRTDGSQERVQMAGCFVMAYISYFLASVCDINITEHVDIDVAGAGSSRSQTHLQYMQTTEKGRSLLRTLEVACQALYDDAAALFGSLQYLDFSQETTKELSLRITRWNNINDAVACNLAITTDALDALFALGLEQASLEKSAYNSAIERRRSRPNVLDAADTAPTLLPYQEEEDVVDMELAFSRPGVRNAAHPLAMQVAPSMYTNGSHHRSDTSLNTSEKSRSDGAGEPVTPTWLPHEEGDSSTLVATAEGELEPDAFDDETSSLFNEGPSSNKPQKATKIYRVLGQEAPRAYVEKANVDQQPWYLRPSYDQSEILMDPDGTVRAGAKPALIERLTAHETADTTFAKHLMITFKSFMSLDELFDLLVQRFWIQPPGTLTPAELEDWTKQKQVMIRLRVLNTFKTMVMDEDVLEKDDMYILDKIREFAAKPDVGTMAAARQLVVQIERVQKGEVGVKTVPVTNAPPPPPILPKANKKLKLLDIDPLELARQLTLMESSMYKKIRPIECLTRSREQRVGKNNDNIASIIQLSNRIANWVADCVLSKEDSRKRAAVVKHFIAVADRCRILQNFSTMCAITSGLNTPHIRRLKRTWEQVSQRFTQQLSLCESTIDSNKNFNNYRSTLARITPPCVPFLGTYLTTLTFINDGAEDKVAGHMINFRKRQKAAEVIQDMKRWQSAPYNFATVAQVLAFLEESLGKYQDGVDYGDQFWHLSLEREPREREDEKMARLLQESGFL